MKMIFCLLIFSILSVKAEMITCTAAGTKILSQKDSVYYTFSYDINKVGSLVFNGETFYQDFLSTDTLSIDYFYAEFQGEYALIDTQSANSGYLFGDFNLGCNKIFGSAGQQSSLVGGDGAHMIQIWSDSLPITNWKTGTLLSGNEGLFNLDGSVYKETNSNLTIISMSNDPPKNVPESSILINLFFSLGSICFVKINNKIKLKKL